MSFTGVNTNVESLFASASLTKLNTLMNRSMQHLASGKRIVTAADDPLGISMLGGFKAQLGGLRTAVTNGEEGASLMQTADAYLNGVVDVLVQMRNLAVRASTEATLTDAQRGVLDDEYQALAGHLENTLDNATFNTKNLFDNSMSAKGIQVGAYGGATITTPSLQSVFFDNLSIGTGGAASGVGTMTAAVAALDQLSANIAKIAGYQGDIGAVARALDNVIADLNMQAVNVAAATSKIEDADLALEVTQFASYQVKAMAATAMIAQANVAPQQVISLLGMGG